MHKLVFLGAAALASAALAQSTLVTLVSGGNSGYVGGGVYFDLTLNTTVAFSRFDYYASTVSTAGASFADIYLGPPTYVGNVTTPALWSIVSSTIPVTIAAGVLTPVQGVLATPFALGPGTYGVALRSNVHSWSYTNGNGTAVPGSGTNQTFSTAELTLRAGAAQNAFLTGGIFTPRVWNGAIVYNSLPPPNGASWSPFGEGCYERARSFYEFWPSSVFVDFGTVAAGGSGITSMLQSLNPAGDYTCTPGTSALRIPTSANLGQAASNNLVVTLNPAGPSVRFVSTNGVVVATAVEMGSDGYLTFNGSHNAALVPNPTSFLTGPAMVGYWHDLDPSQAGASTHYDYDAALGAHVFTWLNCPDYGLGGTSNNYQILIYGNGNLEHRWGAMSQSGGNSWPTVFGYTPGNGSYDPGSSDLSARLQPAGFRTDNLDSPPLDLALNARPVLGTNPALVITGGESAPTQFGAFLAVTFGGFYPVGVPLIFPPFNMPECSQYADFNGSMFFLFGNPPPQLSVPIPGGPQYIGMVVFAQAFGISGTFATTSFGVGANASNGVRAVIGL